MVGIGFGKSSENPLLPTPNLSTPATSN